MQERVIEIEPGARFISAWTLGRKIGELLHPKPDGPKFVASLQKKSAGTGPRNYRIDDLTDADVEYLHRIWPGRDLTVDLNGAAITSERWREIKAIFDAAPDRPAWDLVSKWRNPEQEANSMQTAIAYEHVQSMNKLIAAGTLHAYNANLVAVDKVGGWETVIPADEARVYLAALGIELRERNDALAIIEKMNQSLERQAADVLAGGYRPSEGPYRRTLPPGKRLFTLAEAVRETSSAVHPEQEDDPNSARVTAFILFDAAHPAKEVHLNEEQAREMDEVWLADGLPTPHFPMAQCAFDAYAMALEKSARGQDWSLRPLLRSVRLEAGILREMTRNAHMDLLRQAINAGTVRPLHPATMTPIGATAAGDSALISVDDLVKFAASMPVPVELVRLPTGAEPQPASAEQAETSKRPMPQQRHQEQQVLRVLRELGYDPTALPKAPRGTKGAKAAARDALKYRGKLFDRAWERLRAQREIQDAD